MGMILSRFSETDCENAVKQVTRNSEVIKVFILYNIRLLKLVNLARFNETD